MKANVIRLKVDPTDGEDMRDAISKAIAEAVSEAIEEQESRNPEFGMAIKAYQKHRHQLHKTVLKMIQADETADDIMARIFAIGYTEAIAMKEDEPEEMEATDDR